MKRGITSLVALEFLIGLMIGIAILFAFLSPFKSFTSLLFGRSQACLDDQTKSSVDLIAKELEFLKDSEESSGIINLNGEDCAFFVWDKKNPLDITPPENIFNKNIALCICKLSDNKCVGEFYCQDETTSDTLKNFNSIDFNGSDGKRYIISKKDRFFDTIYYMKQGDKLKFSKNKFKEEKETGQLLDINEIDQTIKIEGPGLSNPTRQRDITLNYDYYDQLNTGGRRSEDSINLIVLHHAGTSTFTGLFEGLKSKGLSAHYGIAKDGTIYYLIQEDKIAWHAKGHNAQSIGIEIINTGRLDDEYTEEQYQAINSLLKDIISRHRNIKFDNEHIKGHYELTAEGKWDPSPNFKWSKIGLADHLTFIALNQGCPLWIASYGYNCDTLIA